MESKTEDIEYKRHIPTPDTKNGMYQEDWFGNFRIVVGEEKSCWQDIYDGVASLNIGGELFIGVSPHWGNILPSRCVLKIQKADENGDTDFYKFKIVDLCQDIVLNNIEIADILKEKVYEEDYTFFVKTTKIDEFVKIKIIEISLLGGDKPDRILSEEEVKDFLIDIFDSFDYDVINTKENKIN